jgi:DNA-binding response OmpR family regulator
MDEKINILFAEDEPALARIVKESLETRNFNVHVACHGEEAFILYSHIKPEILVLDIMMPRKDGLALAREIRQVDKVIPIIFLTAKSQTVDVVEGFNAGGNDYLKKPFSMEELIVRIHNLMQRQRLQEENKILSIGDFTFDFPKQTLQYRDQEAELLTHREAHLLFHLCRNKNKTLERSVVLKKLWGDDDFFNARSMDVFITRLRKKLKKDKDIQIVNVRGFGYKLIV